MRTVLAKNIKNKLEKKIKGDITVKFFGNHLIVRIKNQLTWQYVEELSYGEIYHEITSDEKSFQIYVQYLKYIEKKFFR